MNKHISLLAAGLLGAFVANAQSTTGTTTNSSTTNSTYGTSNSTTGTGTMNNTGTGTTTGSGTYSNGTTTGTTTDGTMNNAGTNVNGSTTTNTGTPAYGTTTTTTTDTYNTTTQPERTKKDYKNFVFGIYAGLNSTKLKGESINTGGKLSGRVGYQAGFFVRGGGRLYGQIGAEYFASSSNYFVAGSGQSASSIQSQIDIKYIQVPVYIGYKLVQSERGISAVRVQVGLEYANQIGSSANDFGSFQGFNVKSGTFNGLGQLGFDAGPIFLDLTYHYGFSDAVSATQIGFAGSQRRILSASVGFKF